jgi:hypothetical protein
MRFSLRTSEAELVVTLHSGDKAGCVLACQERIFAWNLLRSSPGVAIRCTRPHDYQMNRLSTKERVWERQALLELYKPLLPTICLGYSSPARVSDEVDIWRPVDNPRPNLLVVVGTPLCTNRLTDGRPERSIERRPEADPSWKRRGAACPAVQCKSRLCSCLVRAGVLVRAER